MGICVSLAMQVTDRFMTKKKKESRTKSAGKESPSQVRTHLNIKSNINGQTVNKIFPWTWLEVITHVG